MAAQQSTYNVQPSMTRAGVYVIVLAGIIVSLWVFPAFWYKPSGKGQTRLWLRERDQIDGWVFQSMAVAESAEKLLVADALFSGAFTNVGTGKMVQVFSAKRYSQKGDEIGLFMHTPDRCWTDGGWDIAPISPDVLEFEVRGVRMLFERRLFVHGSQRELVYFGGMVGGQALPYRLDHNLPVGLRRALRVKAGTGESAVRAANTQFWSRIWRGFIDRNPLVGPKQFVRISTASPSADATEADRILQDFLGRWLEPSDYEAEIQAWLAKPKPKRSEPKSDQKPHTSGRSQAPSGLGNAEKGAIRDLAAVGNQGRQQGSED